MIQLLKKAVDENTTYRVLLDEVEKTKLELTLAYSNFENVVDPDLIDSCIYHVNAIQMRYKFLLTRVKQIEGYQTKKTEDFHAKNPLELSES